MDPEKDLTPTQEDKEDSLLWEYLENGEYDYQRPQRGDIRNGVILRKDAEQIIVDIGGKREGIVPATDLERLGAEAVEELEVGEEVPVYVLKPESREGDIIVSINTARQVADWKRAEELMEAEEILEKEIIGFNKGGLLVELGHLQGFIPRSHIVNLAGRTKSGPPIERLSQIVGRELPLKIIEVNQRQRRLILSERAAWREWRAEQKERLLEDLEVGDMRKGTVSSLADFGAFVDLGGADGLIHISELSWDRGQKPSDVVQVGDEVEVKIINVDRERMRIGLSLKQCKPNPWETIEDRYAIGQYVDVEITNLVKFGAFARLEEGIEGLIHISELAEHNVQHPNEVVEAGQSLAVQIISLEPERKRIGLSLRRVPDHLRTPIETEEEKLREPEEPEKETAAVAAAAAVETADAEAEGAPERAPTDEDGIEEEAIEDSDEAPVATAEAADGETEAVGEAGPPDAEPTQSVDNTVVSPDGSEEELTKPAAASINGDETADEETEVAPTESSEEAQPTPTGQ